MWRRLMFYPGISYAFLVCSLLFSRSAISGPVLRDWRGQIALSRTLNLYRNMPLYRFDILKTEKGAVAKIIVGQSLRLYLGEDGKLVVENVSSERILFQLHRGILRVEEKKGQNYQIKTPMVFISSGRRISDYFISANAGRTEVICASGEKRLFEFKLKFDGMVTNGFIHSARGGTLLSRGMRSVVITGENNQILPPSRPQRVENRLISHYYRAILIKAGVPGDSKASIVEMISHDTPIPPVDKKDVEKIIDSMKVYVSEITGARYFEPEEREGLTPSGIK